MDTRRFIVGLYIKTGWLHFIFNIMMKRNMKLKSKIRRIKRLRNCMHHAKNSRKKSGFLFPFYFHAFSSVDLGLAGEERGRAREKTQEN